MRGLGRDFPSKGGGVLREDTEVGDRGEEMCEASTDSAGECWGEATIAESVMDWARNTQWY